MPRKDKFSKSDDDYIEAELLRVFKCTSQEDRLEIAQRWCQTWDVAPKFTERRDIAPIYFILASLIDVEHPLIMAERGLMYGYVVCIVKILQTELRGIQMPIPACTQALKSRVVARENLYTGLSVQSD